MKSDHSIQQQNTRRDFLRRSATVAAGATVAPLAIGRSAHAAGSDILKVGLIGCGGRGSGAAVNAMNAGEDAYPIEGTVIDLEPFLRDDTLLGLPLLPICSETCEGLVSTSETGLNTDPPGEPDDTGSPFAVLRDLLPPGD